MKKFMIPLVIVAVGAMFLFLHKSNFEYLNDGGKTLSRDSGNGYGQQPAIRPKYRKPWEL